MNKKEVIILIVVAILVVGIVVFGLARQGESEGNSQEGLVNGEEDVVEEDLGFTTEVPEDVDLSETRSIVPVLPGAEAQIRTFDLSITDNGFEPSELVVNKGDTVQINLSSIGGNYDFFIPAIGIYQTVEAGEKKRVGFQALASGTYVFQCRDLCPDDEIKGSLIVLDK